MSKRAALVALGAALIVSGGVLVAGGGALVAVVGPDGTLSSGDTTLTSTTSALVTSQGDIDARGAEILTDPSLELKVRSSDKPVFVGVGPADEVDRYLAGASIEKVTDFELNPFGMTTDVRDGATHPGSPLDETFWVAQSTGSASAETTWDVQDGHYRVVVMNADGSPGIQVEGDFGLHVPRVVDIGAGLLAGGLVLVPVGVALVVVGLRTRPPVVPVETTSQYVAVRL